MDICNRDGDKYRFGFNGKEKVNEWSGVGNHNTAEFGEYDTRSGRRLNLDTKPNPSLSSYNVFGNSPIWKTDLLLDTPSTRRMATSTYFISIQANVEETVLYTGHAWIKVVNLRDISTTTYGLWGNTGKTEFWKNKEKDNKNYFPVTNRSLYISTEDYQKFYDFTMVRSNVDWTATNTCAGFASRAWKATTGESLNSSNVLGWCIPGILAGSINQKNGGKSSNVAPVPADDNNTAKNSSAESSNSNSSSSSSSNGSDSGSSTSSSSSGCFGADDLGSAGSSVSSSVGGGGSSD